MADVVRELLITEVAAGKLGRRNISDREVGQLINNRYAIFLNRWRHDRRDKARTRRLLVGSTDGGRTLTLVDYRADHLDSHHRMDLR